MPGKMHMTGIAGFDREHRHIAEIIGRARGLCAMGEASQCTGCTLATRDRCSGQLAAIMAELACYLAEHFRHEEEEMDRVAPRHHRVAHRDAHTAVFNQVQALVDEFSPERSAAEAAHSLTALLDGWLEDHTRQHDQALAGYLLEEAEVARAA